MSVRPSVPDPPRRRPRPPGPAPTAGPARSHRPAGISDGHSWAPASSAPRDPLPTPSGLASCFLVFFFKLSELFLETWTRRQSSSGGARTRVGAGLRRCSRVRGSVSPRLRRSPPARASPTGRVRPPGRVCGEPGERPRGPGGRERVPVRPRSPAAAHPAGSRAPAPVVARHILQPHRTPTINLLKCNLSQQN